VFELKESRECGEPREINEAESSPEQADLGKYIVGDYCYQSNNVEDLRYCDVL
jgi:hypothetical protein